MLTGYEQETIINFNKSDKMASIFTYEKSWQKHIEQRFKIKPLSKNSHGGKEYEIPKDRIRKPYPKRHTERPSVIMKRTSTGRIARGKGA